MWLLQAGDSICNDHALHAPWPLGLHALDRREVQSQGMPVIWPRGSVAALVLGGAETDSRCALLCARTLAALHQLCCVSRSGLHQLLPVVTHGSRCQTVHHAQLHSQTAVSIDPEAHAASHPRGGQLPFN